MVITSARLHLAGLVLVAANCLVACTAPSESPSWGLESEIDANQQAFVGALLAAPLPVALVQARIEAAGYTWRIVEIDGQPQPATMDYRIDRLNLATQGGLVTDAFWG